MSERAQYVPGPAFGAQVKKGGDKWTLILVRELRHSPEKIWKAITDPVHLREWAPFDVDGPVDQLGATVKLTWVGNPASFDVKVIRVEAPRVLEFGDMRWELEPIVGGTRLTFWANIDRRFVSWGAAGWHISFDVLDRLLAGEPIQRLAGGDATRSEGWQQLVAEYKKQFEA